MKKSFFTSIFTYALVALSRSIDFVVRAALSLVQKVADIAPEKFSAEIQHARNWVVRMVIGAVRIGCGAGGAQAREHVAMLRNIGQRSCCAA